MSKDRKIIDHPIWHPVRVLLWIPYFVVAVICDIIGLVVIPILIAANRYDYRRSYIPAWSDRVLLQFTPRWAWIWSNEEDGIDGLRGGDPAQYWWRDRYPNRPRWRMFVWSALRNPSNNLRAIPHVNPRISPPRIHSYRFANGNVDFTWQGLFAGFRAFFAFGGSLWRFWIGWKLKPDDANGLAEDDYRRHTCGFARQLKRVYAKR